MLSRLGIEASPAVQYAIAFVIILGLVTVFGLVLRRLSSARLMLPGQDRGRSRQPRLGVVDIYDLDRQRQLILLRRDNVEHLLLIGGPNDVVIETNIVRVPPSRTAAPAPDAERLDEAAPPARPAIEAATARLGPALARSEDSDTAQELSPVASIPPVPTPARTEPMLKPDAVTLAPQAPAADIIPQPTDRPVPPVRPESVPERPTGVPVRPRVPEPPGPPARAPAAAAPTPSPAAPTAPAAPPRVPDEAILNDMARQLEAALRRPTPPAVPAPAMPTPPEPRREEARREEPRRDEPRRDGPPPGPPLRATVAPEPPRPAPAAPIPAAPTPPAAAPATSTPPRPAPEPPRPPQEPPREPAAADTPASGPATAASRNPDPFSVEDIEAEFARLLGRPSDKS